MSAAKAFLATPVLVFWHTPEGAKVTAFMRGLMQDSSPATAHVTSVYQALTITGSNMLTVSGVLLMLEQLKASHGLFSEVVMHVCQ
jgi:hypothetical protein